VVAAVDPELTDPHTILRLLPHGVVVVATDWRITFANPEAVRMLGATGDTLWARCPELEQTAFAAGVRYAMLDRTERLTESALPAVGWCQARARPTPDGGLLISLRQVHAHTLETGQARQALLVGEIGDALTREDSLQGALQRSAAAIVRNLDATLARILAYSRAGRDSGDAVPVALGALAKEVWELLAPPVTAHLSLAGTFPTLEASRVQLQPY